MQCIVSPVSRRLIKVDGKVYKKLVRTGVVDPSTIEVLTLSPKKRRRKQDAAQIIDSTPDPPAPVMEPTQTETTEPKLSDDNGTMSVFTDNLANICLDWTEDEPGLLDDPPSPVYAPWVSLDYSSL